MLYLNHSCPNGKYSLYSTGVDIESLNLEKSSSLWHVRNYFLFSFYCAGIRFTDLALMKWDNIKDGRLVYQRGKNDKWKDIDMMPPAFEILEYYRDHSETIKNFIFHVIHQKHTTVKDKRAEGLYYKLVENPELIDNQDISDLREALTIGLKWIKKIEYKIALLITESTDSNYPEEYLPNMKEQYWKKHLGRSLKYKKTNLRIRKRIKELAEHNASESD